MDFLIKRQIPIHFYEFKIKTHGTYHYLFAWDFKENTPGLPLPDLPEPTAGLHRLIPKTSPMKVGVPTTFSPIPEIKLLYQKHRVSEFYNLGILNSLANDIHPRQ